MDALSRADAAHLRHEEHKAVSISQRVVLGGAIVETKHLFGNVTIEMKRLDSNGGVS
jgi:hypothetical protein